MFKTFERTERTPPDIAGQGTESPDEKRTKNGYERTRTDKMIFVTRPLARCDRNFRCRWDGKQCREAVLSGSTLFLKTRLSENIGSLRYAPSKNFGQPGHLPSGSF